MESSSRWRQERRTASDGDLVEVSGAGGERGDAVVDDEAVPERSMNVGSATLFARRSHLRARREMAGKPRARPSPARIPGSTAWNRTSQSTGVAVPWSCSVVPINRRGLMKGRTVGLARAAPVAGGAWPDQGEREKGEFVRLTGGSHIDIYTALPRWHTTWAKVANS
uniref:Uncharacterized protein n=1 Tax=Oryza sativa subsp. japonica TaxID=39947 RepID=Q6EP63_ORYSJ|nr:hypothetical protein [Oryza sativa Japonica Group]BAD38250.1 hypothetical protein [Oryza sativa Japonica Group]